MTNGSRASGDADRPAPRDPAADLLTRASDDASAVRRAAFTRLRSGQPVAPTELATETGLAAEAVGAALDDLVAAGAANVDARGRVVAAAGLSIEPTPHALLLGGARLWTWCAFDAVGIPAALRMDAMAQTRCGHCAEPIEVTIRSGIPQDTGSVAGWLPGHPCKNVQVDFCPQANFFCGDEHLSQWRASAGDPPGSAATVVELAAHGSDVWSEMSTDAPR